MKDSRTIFATLGLSFVVLWVGSALADNRHHKDEVVRARLVGFAEVPLTLSTPGRGRFHAVLDEDEQTISYRLTYGGLEADVTQAHIHFGRFYTAGGVSAFLCSNVGGPPGTPACPAQGGEVTGTLTPESVIGPAGQGISPGEFAKLVAAIRSGNTYANVHSTKYPAGEIRGQIHPD